LKKKKEKKNIKKGNYEHTWFEKYENNTSIPDEQLAVTCVYPFSILIFDCNFWFPYSRRGFLPRGARF